MEPHELAGVLDFLRASERLKITHRSAYTSEGQQESVAEHTWRLCLMALVLARQFPQVDFAKLVKICLVHDLGEAVGGDVPAPEQARRRAAGVSTGKGEDERRDLMTLLEPLPAASRQEIAELWDEYENARPPEARLAKVAMSLLDDIDKDTVDFADNYDGSYQEPTVLPARFPNLLVNGAGGIAVGMATNIPPHNLGEVVKACIALIDDRELTTTNLLKFIQGPDFPTGGQILNSKPELRQIYDNGQGAVRVRAEYKVETRKKGSDDIIVTSIPYGVNKATVVERIAEVIIKRQLAQLTDVRDESTDDVRIVLEIKKDADPAMVMAYLYKHTPLQLNFNVNFTCLVPGPGGGDQRLDERRRGEVGRRRLRAEKEARARPAELGDDRRNGLVDGLGVLGLEAPRLQQLEHAEVEAPRERRAHPQRQAVPSGQARALVQRTVRLAAHGGAERRVRPGFPRLDLGLHAGRVEAGAGGRLVRLGPAQDGVAAEEQLVADAQHGHGALGVGALLVGHADEAHVERRVGDAGLREAPLGLAAEVAEGHAQQHRLGHAPPAAPRDI